MVPVRIQIRLLAKLECRQAIVESTDQGQSRQRTILLHCLQSPSCPGYMKGCCRTGHERSRTSSRPKLGCWRPGECTAELPIGSTCATGLERRETLVPLQSRCSMQSSDPRCRYHYRPQVSKLVTLIRDSRPVSDAKTSEQVASQIALTSHQRQRRVQMVVYRE